jgi:hypothetical protein
MSRTQIQDDKVAATNHAMSLDKSTFPTSKNNSQIFSEIPIIENWGKHLHSRVEDGEISSNSAQKYLGIVQRLSLFASVEALYTSQDAPLSPNQVEAKLRLSPLSAINPFVQDLKDRGASAETIRRNLSTIRSFYASVPDMDQSLTDYLDIYIELQKKLDAQTKPTPVLSLGVEDVWLNFMGKNQFDDLGYGSSLSARLKFDFLSFAEIVANKVLKQDFSQIDLLKERHSFRQIVGAVIEDRKFESAETSLVSTLLKKPVESVEALLSSTAKSDRSSKAYRASILGDFYSWALLFELTPLEAGNQAISKLNAENSRGKPL